MIKERTAILYLFLQGTNAEDIASIADLPKKRVDEILSNLCADFGVRSPSELVSLFYFINGRQPKACEPITAGHSRKGRAA